MAEKIRVELDAATSAGANEIVGDVKKVDDVIGNLRQEFADTKAEAERLAESERKAAAATDKLGDEARQTGEQLNNAGKAGDSLKSLERLGKLVLSMQALKFAVQGAGQAIKALDEDGSPAFMKLNEAIQEAYGSLLDIGNDPTVYKWAESLSVIVKEKLNPALSQIPGIITEIQDDISNGLVAIGEWSGLIKTGILDNQLEAQVRQVKINDELKKTIEIEKEKVNVDDKIAAQQQKIQDEREAANIRNIEDSKTLRMLLDEETQALREMEQSGEKDRTKKAEQLKKIENIQRTLADLPSKIFEKERKYAEESAKARSDAEQQYQDAVKAATEEANKVRDEHLKKTIDAAEAKRQELLRAISDAKGPGGGNAIDEAKKGISKDATLKQIQKSRADAAEQELRDKLKSGGELDQNGKAIDENPAERARKQRAIDEKIRRARQQAGAGAFRDARGGKISDTEVNDAQSELINSNIKQANAGQRMGNATVSMGQEAVEANRAAANALAEQQKQIDEFREQLRATTAMINGNQQKTRNQRGSTRG